MSIEQRTCSKHWVNTDYVTGAYCWGCRLNAQDTSHLFSRQSVKVKVIKAKPFIWASCYLIVLLYTGLSLMAMG